MVHDLFAVSNHLGSMAGGHYTSFCRAVPCQPNGTEEAASSVPSDGEKTQYPWLHFDDQYVEEVPPERINSGAAPYVLFYRRRHLTPSNVVNMTT